MKTVDLCFDLQKWCVKMREWCVEVGEFWFENEGIVSRFAEIVLGSGEIWV